MPTIPASIPSRAVHIHITGGSGQVVSLRSPALFDASGSLILPSTRWSATLDAEGEATLTVPCTDTGTISPVDWSYQVVTTLATLPRFMRLQVPAGVGDLEFASAVNYGTPPSPTLTYATTAALTGAIATHAAADDPHGDRAYTDQTIAVLDEAIRGDGGLGERVENIENGDATLAALNVTANATIGGTLTTTGPANIGGANFLLPLKLRGLLTYPGPPATGTWAIGELVVGSTAIWWICTVAGTDLGATWVSAP